MKIVFMGTPDFAVGILKHLIENDCNIVGVITATDKAAGRGNKIQYSAVKKYALEQGLNILQPKNLKSPKFLKELKALEADLQVVVAFRMLPAVVFEMPPKGTVNLHGSLLPQYRGAAPINWAVINGEKKSGVTTFFIEQQIDTGQIIFKGETEITENMTAGELHDLLMVQGAEVMLKTVRAIEAGDFPQIPQPNDVELKPAPKIFKEDCKIDWNRSTDDLHNFIRGLSPYPAAYTVLQNKRFKIFRTTKINQQTVLEPGQIDTDNKTYIHIATKDGYLCIKELQMEGKRKMKVADLLRGFNFEIEKV